MSKTYQLTEINKSDFRKSITLCRNCKSLDTIKRFKKQFENKYNKTNLQIDVVNKVGKVTFVNPLLVK